MCVVDVGIRNIHTQHHHRSGGLSAGVGSAISLLEGDVMDNYVVYIASLQIGTVVATTLEHVFVSTLNITQGCGSNAPTLFSKAVNKNIQARDFLREEITGVPFDRAAWARGDDLCVKVAMSAKSLSFFSMSVGVTFVPNNGVPELLTPALSPDAVTQHIAAGSYDDVNTTWGMNGELSSSAQTYAGVITCTEYGKLRFSLESRKQGFVTIHDHTGAVTEFFVWGSLDSGSLWMDVPCVKHKLIFVVSEQLSHFSWAFLDVTAAPPTDVPTVTPNLAGIPTYVWLAGSGALLVVVLAGVLFACRRRSAEKPAVAYNGQQHCQQDAALIECDERELCSYPDEVVAL